MFELLFKYPASVFHKGHFVLLTPWPSWLLLAAVLAAAGFLFWHVTRNRGMLTGLRPICIGLLETSLIALILFLLWHPALSVATLRPQQNVVAVLIDDSRSMSIPDASGTRMAAAQAVLKNSLLQSLSQKFQVRLYKFGKEPERIPKPDQVTAAEPASRIGESLERVLAESSSMPLGAIVLLSDGADNSGGISLDTISAIRRQRIPVHTLGFGKEHPSRDTEIADAIVPSRALPNSRLTAQVTLQSYGLSGVKTRLSVRDNGKILASQEVALKGDGALQTESLVFDAGEAGAKTLEISVDAVPGEENALNNRVTRLVDVQNRKPRILYIEGEPRWEFKFIRRALDDYTGIEIVSMLRTTQNKFYFQSTIPPGTIRDSDKQALGNGFPATAESLFQYQGLIVGSVEANYFSTTQQQLIRDFVDRRGGGLLFLGGRATLSDGGYQTSPFADLVPAKLADNKGTFHRDFVNVELTAEGRQSVITRLADDPARNQELWTPGNKPENMPQFANYQDVGEAKPGAATLLNVGPRHTPLLVTENYGRGRTLLFATGGSWRWKMWKDHNDKTHATFWQQLLRYMVSETPGQVTANTPKTVIADEATAPLRVEVRDKEYKPVANAKVEAHVMGPDGMAATVALAPQPMEEGIFTGEISAEKTGSYVVEIQAVRDQEDLGRDSLTFWREDGVAENFHTGQNRELLQKLSDQTGGRYYKPEEAAKLDNDISYSEAGITTRETRDLWDMPVVFLLALLIRGSEWVLRRRWGVV